MLWLSADVGTSGIDNPRSNAQCLFRGMCIPAFMVVMRDILSIFLLVFGSEPTPSVKSTGGCGCRVQKYCGHVDNHVDKGSREFLSRSIFFSFSRLRTLPLVMLTLPVALAALAGFTHAQITGTFPATPLASLTGISYPSGIVSIPFYSYTSATSTVALS